MLWHSSLGNVSVLEQIYTLGKKTIRPFQLCSGIIHRKYSNRAQLIITDLGSDTPFNKINAKLQLHHGIGFAESSIQKITLFHASRIKDKQLSKLGQTANEQGKKVVISETDGCMVGIIKIDSEALDKRKNKKANWQELKLSMAFEHGSLTPYFSGTLGNAQEAGKHMYHCVKSIG